MSKKQRKRIVMRDAAGNITYDSDAIQKLILKLADSPLISFSSGSISPQSKWAKETIKLLKEHGEMKNIDIILALDKKGKPPSYHHISQIFKSESDRKFYNEELIKNGVYWSLKSAK
ncbi:MAG: hypothetical protein HN815_06755 [Candidatus Marinimicrobia bacterium]|nr:hypothetical protein [Candidatus Neomarinimicrobiota bacterium]